MKGKIVRIFLISLLFLSILSPLSAAELWGAVAAGIGFLPGAFSSISLLNIDGTAGLGIHELFKTPLRSDFEVTYAGYLPSAESSGWLESMHGMQGMFLLGYQAALGGGFSLTPRAGAGIQLLFTSSAANYDDFEAGVFTNRYGTQLVIQGGLLVDYSLSRDWSLGLEGAYQMLSESDGVHHGAVVKLVLSRKLAELAGQGAAPESAETVSEKPPIETISADKLVPLRGLDEVLIYETENQLTIVLLNSFAAYESVLTEKADENLIVVGEYMQEIENSGVRFYGYVANTREDEAKLDQELSLSRAQAVRDWLLINGYIDTSKETTAEGHSGSSPIGDNSTAEGRALNRRVEIVIDLEDEGE